MSRQTINHQVIRLTNGPKHHLFGFHDLIISNPDDTKYLCLEVDCINRPPLAGELFGVGYVENEQFIRVGETTALNYPQGSRQQWVGKTELVTVNNRVGHLWGTDLYDAKSNCLIDRYDATSHMLSKDGRLAFGLDYARLFRLGGYGYSGIGDSYLNDPIPSQTGITILDLQTKEIKLLVSVKEVACFGTRGRIPGTSHHYLTHLCVNPSSTRIAFLHRYFMGDGGMMTRLMTIGTDGSNLRCLAQGFLSHFDWKDDNHLYIYGRANSAVDSIRNNPLFSNPIVAPFLRVAQKALKIFLHKEGKSIAPSSSFLEINDSSEPVIQPFAQSIITSDGHPMTCPMNSDWCVCDTYPDDNGIRSLMLYRFSNNSRIDLGRFKKIDEKPDMTLALEFFAGVDPTILNSIAPDSLAFTRSGLHCDLHPRWNSKGDKVVFDSIHEGSRQVYLVNVDSIINQ